MAESVDAADSKSAVGNNVRVRVSLEAPYFSDQKQLSLLAGGSAARSGFTDQRQAYSALLKQALRFMEKSFVLAARHTAPTEPNCDKSNFCSTK